MLQRLAGLLKIHTYVHEYIHTYIHTQEEMLQRLAGLLKEADLAPHLVASALQDNEVRFLQWVASHYAPPPDQGSGAQEGTVTAVTDGTRLVLQALRDQDEGLRARRRQLDDNVQGLLFDSGGSLSALDGGKIGLPRPRDRWWERSDKVFTQENERNSLLVKMAGAAGSPGGADGELTSPAKDRKEQMRQNRRVGWAQRQGYSWCALPLASSPYMYTYRLIDRWMDR